MTSQAMVSAPRPVGRDVDRGSAHRETRLWGVLDLDQRSVLSATGVVRLPGVVARDVADAMADRVWAVLARRGVDRADPSTWLQGFVGQLQPLRQGRVFDGFTTAVTDAFVDELLGAGRWRESEPWGPALVTFPEPEPWVLPHKMWHLDLPGRGDPDQVHVARLFGYVTDVVPQGGGTLVVEGSDEVIRRMVRAAPGHDAGSSADLRRKLIRRHPWFRALCSEGGDRVAQFMVDGDEVDGVRVRVSELTAEAGDVVAMLPWTMHNLSMNCAAAPRFMVTHSIYRSPA